MLVQETEPALPPSLLLVLVAPSPCSSGRSHSISCHSSSLPEPLQIKAWVQDTNPHVIIDLFPLIVSIHKHSFGMEKAWSPEANPLHPFYLGHWPKPPLFPVSCPSITRQETPLVSMEKPPCVAEASLCPELPGLVGLEREGETRNDDME